jgi:predicted methyltransferase
VKSETMASFSRRPGSKKRAVSAGDGSWTHLFSPRAEAEAAAITMAMAHDRQPASTSLRNEPE